MGASQLLWACLDPFQYAEEREDVFDYLLADKSYMRISPGRGF